MLCSDWHKTALELPGLISVLTKAIPCQAGTWSAPLLNLNKVASNQHSLILADPEDLPHTPSLTFRHLPPRRKDFVNQCMESP